MSIFRKSLLSSALVFAAPLAGFCAQLPADKQAVRLEFVAAMQRVRAHHADATDSPALKAYVIYDYLVAARLRRDLTQRPAESLDSAVDAFLRAHAGYPVVRGLRRDWLLSLGQRRRWDLFLQHSQDTADPALICYRLEGRLTNGDTAGIANAALAVWMLPQKPLPECNAVFAWLRQNGLFTPALAESRSRAALAADNPHLAREFAADVPLTHRAALLQWSDLLESPKSALSVLAAHASMPVEAEALASGFDKLAHTDPAAALDLLPRLLARDQMTADLRARLKRTAALGAAYDHDPRALALFDDLPAAAIDSQTHEWRVRTAVWIGDYAKALLWIERMPTTLFAQPRWRYWRARAVSATLGEAAAAPLWREIAGLRDYYGYLAADRLHETYNLNARPSPFDAATQSTLAADLRLVRAHELFDCDMWDEATTEWLAAVGSADSAIKVQAALLAARWGWFAEAIATLVQTGDFDDVNLRYPRLYLDSVDKASSLARVPPDWILAVIRQESLFRKDAVSRADARGVMQMLPATASAVAHRWHISSPAGEALFDPSVAIPLGAAYLRELLDRYGGQLALGLAAYNAGPAAIARWLPHGRMDADVWIENIPYNETRGYVQHILEHIIAYAWVRDAEPPRLETLLPAIEPAAPIL
jgi:soluble lytic murein transglycosylase